MKLTSDSFKDGDYLPQDHILSADYGFGCGGANRSPHLKWADAPAGTVIMKSHSVLIQWREPNVKSFWTHLLA